MPFSNCRINCSFEPVPRLHSATNCLRADGVALHDIWRREIFDLTDEWYFGPCHDVHRAFIGESECDCDLADLLVYILCNPAAVESLRLSLFAILHGIAVRDFDLDHAH